ncbi:M1 family metallopeptidase, partial [Candidatus Sumerlaeota bacterium]|nr:M1 family metallopeptidase [Candidatus Sumerlaeota bacterium]
MRFYLRIVAIAGLAAFARGGQENMEIRCLKSAPLKGADQGEKSRQYAPDREIDIQHLVIDVTPDFKARTVAGKTTIRFAPIARPLTELRLDAVDLDVSGVESSAKIAGHQVTREEILITFENPIPPGKVTTVTISHEAEPKEGLYFRNPEMGYKAEDMHLWTQGETHEARHWFPSLDYPNEKFTSEMICHVPADMTVLSNGRLAEEKTEPAGMKAVRWIQEQPHSNYLIALAAGYFAKAEAMHGNVPLAFFTPKSQIGQAMNSFRDTDDMMSFFEQETGTPYPWTKYFQVVVDDFNHGGMENTSLTILTDRTLHTDATENIRDSDGLISHELAHQWFGDYVTCKDWSHIWLNEGFATYYALLYDGHKNGRDSMLYGLWKNAGRLIAENQSVPIVNKDYTDAMENFGTNGYEKGGWVLHMLRAQLGDDLYKKCIKRYLEQHAFGNVVTEDLNSVVEELSGRSFDPFFDQWVYHGGLPKLEIGYEWNEKSKLAKITVKQTQEVGDKVMLFTIPAKIRYKGKSGVIDQTIEIRKKEEEFYFPLKQAPAIVRFDPDLTVLGGVNFNVPNQMLYAQLEDREDGIGRVIAADALKSRKDGESVRRLKNALNSDSFYGVRIEAAKSLREIHSKEAFEALTDSLKQSDARVRKEVVQNLGEFFRAESAPAAKKAMETEQNPEIVAAAIQSLGKYHDPETREILTGYLQSDSYRNILASSAVEAIRSLDDPAFIEPLKKTLSARESSFTSWGFGAALGALGYLARNEEKKDATREFLSG